MPRTRALRRAGRAPGWLRLVAGLALTAAVTACGASLPGSQAEVALGDPAGTHDCQGIAVDPSRLDQLPTAAQLSGAARAPLQGAEVPPLDDPGTWRVVSSTDSQLTMVRELEVPEDLGGGDIRTHEQMAIERFGPEDETGRPGWHLRSAGSCDLRADTGDLGEASVQLDPASPPSAQDTSVALLVNERDCASGQAADGRIEVVELERTDTEVRFVLGVRPLEGDQECPGNPDTPYELDLGEPLGDRTLVDASVAPPRELWTP